MKLGLKFNKNTLLSIVFAIILVVFALWLVNSLDKRGREGGPEPFNNSIRKPLSSGKSVQTSNTLSK